MRIQIQWCVGYKAETSTVFTTGTFLHWVRKDFLDESIKMRWGCAIIAKKRFKGGIFTYSKTWSDLIGSKKGDNFSIWRIWYDDTPYHPLSFRNYSRRHRLRFFFDVFEGELCTWKISRRATYDSKGGSYSLTFINKHITSSHHQEVPSQQYHHRTNITTTTTVPTVNSTTQGAGVYNQHAYQ